MLHAIVPAAGDGLRFGAKRPKHLLEVAGRTILDHSIAALLADARLAKVHVALSEKADPDVVGSTLPKALAEKVEVHQCGQKTRAKTVLAAAKLAAEDNPEWLAVHDAVRPCLHKEDLGRLLDEVEESSMPALLVARLPDTLKQGRDGMVVATIPREDKFLAQTPQVAKTSDLIEALTRHQDVTDESQALELLGLSPKLVEAAHPNPKLTYPQDLKVVAALLNNTQEED